ncbi:MAG: NYN domain-containing protein [archaeon]|nr:NYN domain-containing protein [archaeon]
MPNETAVFIDAGYLSRIAKHFGNGKYLKYSLHAFAINIAKEFGLWCEDIYFYTAPPFQCAIPTPEESKRRSDYDKFIKKIASKRPTTYIREGRCQKIDGVYKQKGVDGLMIKDLIVVAQRKQHKKVILITSDTDFVQVLEELKRDYGIKIILAYYTDRKRGSGFSMSNHLWNICDEKLLLEKEHFFSSLQPKL